MFFDILSIFPSILLLSPALHPPPKKKPQYTFLVSHHWMEVLAFGGNHSHSQKEGVRNKYNKCISKRICSYSIKVLYYVTIPPLA